jgi:histidyl-tRNA synthetase
VDEADYHHLLSLLRTEGKNCVATFNTQKFGKIFADGEKRQCRWVVVYGDREYAAGTYLIKDLVSGEQVEIVIS